MIRVAVTSPLSALHNSFFIVRNLLIRCLTGVVTVLDSPHAADLHIHIGTPEPEQSFLYAPSEGRLIFYSFAEAPFVPSHWAEALNKCLEVWVASEFTRKAFLDSGVTVPIRLIPLGIDISEFGYIHPNNHVERKFTFLWQGTRLHGLNGDKLTDGDRKRGYLVERAFARANLPNSRLILKWLPNDHRTCDFRVGPIWYICRALNSRQVSTLDSKVDLFVWPTMGEGFGLIPLEKLSRGIPVLVTNWSGPRDYLRDFPIQHLDNFDLETVRFNGDLVKMAVVSEAYLVEAMREAYVQREHLNAIREKLAKIVKEKWGLESRMKPQVLAALNSRTSSFPETDHQ
jgi:glycosyltransferase involved in cell wall biosynthesis